MTDAEASLDPEDILSSSLQTLYSYTPLTHSSAGSLFSYTSPSGIKIRVDTPDTDAKNWSLHASSIWNASVFLADRVEGIGVPSLIAQGMSSAENVYGKDRFDILELGAGAGLPSILLAKYLSQFGKSTRGMDISGKWSVVVSDYHDERLISTLRDNVKRNDLEAFCAVIPYDWGSDPSALPSHTSSARGPNMARGFDLIIAADTLWNVTFHAPFVRSLALLLRKSPSARVHLIAGLHTGRYTLQAFFDMIGAEGVGMEVESVVECEVGGDGVNKREWKVDREDEGGEMERRGRRRRILYAPGNVDSSVTPRTEKCQECALVVMLTSPTTLGEVHVSHAERRDDRVDAHGGKFAHTAERDDKNLERSSIG
ncbi:hypothetical protein BD410DRAFT_836464 [Rickenella mellea]|uniref:Uncharacterized protein n=1 Tax=Rickenella mellea TaxID=50990 RepID=A0A4Y7QIE6_9AGAM|nr:hypothetical protein BD410DRAFT_836464 [Rickenella mellea]